MSGENEVWVMVFGRLQTQRQTRGTVRARRLGIAPSGDHAYAAQYI